MYIYIYIYVITALVLDPATSAASLRSSRILYHRDFPGPTVRRPLVISF